MGNIDIECLGDCLNALFTAIRYGDCCGANVLITNTLTARNLAECFTGILCSICQTK